VDISHALPANPSGEAQLQAVLESLPQAPAPELVASLPEIAQLISGKTILLENNPLLMESLRMEFNGTSEATIQIAFTDGSISPLAAVGRDGDFRNTSGIGIDRAVRSLLEVENQPAGLRGAWTDARTFILEYDTLTNRYVYWIQMHFEDNDVTFDLSEQVYGDR
jgi:hypothetical protein